MSSDSAAYVRARKEHLCRIALAETLDADGQVDPDRKAMLARLRDELDIGEDGHAALLEYLRGAGSKTAP